VKEKSVRLEEAGYTSLRHEEAVLASPATGCLRAISAVSQKYLGRASEISHYRRCKTRLGTGIATAYYYWRV
jgi:hypothetical protein